MHCHFAVNRLASKQRHTRVFSSTPTQYAKSTFAAPTSPALLQTTYNNLLQDQVEKYPHKDLVRSVREDLRYNYHQTMSCQDALASAIQGSRIPKGASYTTALPLRIESVISQLATARTTALWASLPPLEPAAVLEKRMKQVKTHTLVWPPKVHNTVQLDEIYEVFPEMSEIADSALAVLDKRFPHLRQVLHTSNKQQLPGMSFFSDFPVYDAPHSINLLEPWIFPYDNKTILVNGDELVFLNQHSIINTGYFVGQQIGLHEEDIVLTTLLPHTSQGLSLGLGMAKLVYASELFDVKHVLNALPEEFCTTLVIEPKNLSQLLDGVKSQDFSRLKKLIVASSPSDRASAQLLERAKTVLGVDSVVLTFGTQKSGGVLSLTKVNGFGNHVGSALPHTQVEIVDDKGTVLEKGVEGWLRVHGFNVPEGTQNTGIKAKLDGDNNIVLA